MTDLPGEFRGMIVELEIVTTLCGGWLLSRIPCQIYQHTLQCSYIQTY